MNDDINALIKLKNQMEVAQNSKEVANARVSNASQTVEDSLVGFVTSRLSQIQNDEQFSNLVKMHLRERLPEFNIDQLLQLNDQNSRNINRAVEGIIPLFQGDNSGKSFTDRLKDNTTSTVAQQLYDNSNADMLQAVSYLGSVLAKMTLPKTDTGTAEVIN